MGLFGGNRAQRRAAAKAAVTQAAKDMKAEQQNAPKYDVSSMTEDEKQRLGAIQALAVTSELLTYGLFPGRLSTQIDGVQSFLEELQKRCISELDVMIKLREEAEVEAETNE